MTKKLDAYVDSGAGQALIDAPPKPGTIVKTTERSEAGVTEWTLSNGATVVLKPTKLKEDQILFRAFAPGGTSLASDADFPSARAADSVIGASGAGQFNAVTLDKLLNGKAVVVQPFIDEIDQGMGGGSTPQDLETLFQLLYLRFTQPRADPTAFAAMAAQARSLLANQQASPDVVFNQTVDAALSGNHPRRQPETPASVDRWNLDRSRWRFYKARFADASNFTFVFVGSFNVDTIKPLVETYLASLPATNAHETWKDLGIMPPATVVDENDREGHRAQEPGRHRLFRPVRLRPAAPARAADDDDAAAVAAVRHDSPGARRHLQHHRRRRTPTSSRTRSTASASNGPATRRAPRRWCSACSRRSSSCKGTRFDNRQMGLVREPLLREFEENSQDNRYFLQLIARAYEDGDRRQRGRQWSTCRRRSAR